MRLFDINYTLPPGAYSAIGSTLLADFPTLMKDAVEMWTSTGYVSVKSFKEKFSEPYYIVLPDAVTKIGPNAFKGAENLVAIGGRNVKEIFADAFADCTYLYEANFPNVKVFREGTFKNCKMLYDKYADKNGCLVISNWLVEVPAEYKDETFIIDKNIKGITLDAFAKSNVKTIVFPLEFKHAFIEVSPSVEVIHMPISTEFFNVNYVHGSGKLRTDLRLIYKGTPDKLAELSKHNVFGGAMSLVCMPIEDKELNSRNYTLDELEIILGKKLTLDDILNYDYSMNEINNFFSKENNDFDR